MTDYKAIYNRLKTGGSLTKSESAYFLPHIIPIIGKLPIRRGIRDTKVILMDLIKSKDEQTYYAIKIIAEIPRSNLHGRKESPRYKALTPLLMYAVREIQGFRYSYWDKNSEGMGVFLGYKLWDNIKDVEVPDIEELKKQRLLHLKTKEEISYKMGKDVTLKQTLNCKHIMLQTWLASPLIRVEDAMLLDIKDWDNSSPEPLGGEMPDVFEF